MSIENRGRKRPANEDPLKNVPVDRIIFGYAQRAADVYKAKLLCSAQEEDEGNLPGTTEAITGEESTINQLDTLQRMLDNWNNPKERKGLELAVQQNKVVGNKEKPTFTARFKPEGTKLPPIKEAAQDQLSLHINMGVPLTPEEALRALSLRHEPHQTLAKYEQEEEERGKRGNSREIIIAVNTVSVYTNRGNDVAIPQAGVQFNWDKVETHSPRAKGVLFKGKLPFTTDLDGIIPLIHFTRMGKRIIDLANPENEE